MGNGRGREREDINMPLPARTALLPRACVCGGRLDNNCRQKCCPQTYTYLQAGSCVPTPVRARMLPASHAEGRSPRFNLRTATRAMRTARTRHLSSQSCCKHTCTTDGGGKQSGWGRNPTTPRDAFPFKKQEVPGDDGRGTAVHIAFRLRESAEITKGFIVMSACHEGF